MVFCGLGGVDDEVEVAGFGGREVAGGPATNCAGGGATDVLLEVLGLGDEDVGGGVLEDGGGGVLDDDVGVEVGVPIRMIWLRLGSTTLILIPSRFSVIGKLLVVAVVVVPDGVAGAAAADDMNPKKPANTTASRTNKTPSRVRP